MAIKRGFAGDAFGERLPWLEPVEEEEYADERGGFGQLILAAVVVLVMIAAVIGGFLWWRGAQARQAAIGTVIHAPAGPYKTRPADPGGMEIASAGAVAERTSVGGDINSPLDLAAIPEAPITGPGSAEGKSVAAPAPAKVPVASPLQTPPPAPAVTVPTAAPAPLVRPSPPVAAVIPPARPATASAAPVGAAGTVQLGAFSTQAKAQAVWKTLSKRFGYLAGLSETVLPVASGGTTLYRLRAGGPGAVKACAQLKIAGETCSVL